MPAAKRNEALSELSLEVFRLTAQLNSAAERLSREAGLSSARWQVLEAITNANAPLPVAEIARRMGLQRQSVQRTTDALEQEGFVSYEPNPRHRRAKLAKLTTRGRDVLKKLGELRDSWSDQFKQELNLHELQQATETLMHLRSLLDQNEH